MKNCLKPHVQSKCLSGILLMFRLVAGLAFMNHGWAKIMNPFDWMGPKASVPKIFLLLAAIAEFCGGFAWIVGLLTPFASLGIACTMIVAVYFHAILFGDPFVVITPPLRGSYELALIYLCVAVFILLSGPGHYSLDRIIFGEKDCKKKEEEL